MVMNEWIRSTDRCLAAHDPEIAAAVRAELAREQDGLELIASENVVSEAVLAAAGSVLTNKYAEGYPAHRYYGGCGCVDVALLHAGDTVMGMSLADGGHLTHGSPVNLSGLYYHFVPYGVDTVTHRIDYDKLEAQAKEVRPKLIVAGASAYPRVIDFPRMAEIAHSVGALLMVDMAHIAGLVAAGEHPSPLPYADVVTTTTHKTLRGPRGGLILTNNEDIAKKVNKAIFPGIQGGPLEHIIAAKAVCFGEALKPEFRDYQHRIIRNARALADALLAEGFDLVSGGTDNHLMLVDLRPMGVTGKEMELRLDEVHITVNKNAIPNDPEKPFVTSGIRVGTPAVTTRGLTEADMATVAHLIKLTASDFEASAEECRRTVAELCRKYPLYS